MPDADLVPMQRLAEAVLTHAVRDLRLGIGYDFRTAVRFLFEPDRRRSIAPELTDWIGLDPVALHDGYVNLLLRRVRSGLESRDDAECASQVLRRLGIVEESRG